MDKRFEIICMECGNESMLINVHISGEDLIASSNQTVDLNARGVDYGDAFVKITCKKCGNVIGM